MRLNLKNISWRSLIIRVFSYLFILYLTAVIVSVSIAGYLFFNLESYKQKICDLVYSNTGFVLQIGKIKSQLNKFYMPELLIGDVTLKNPHNSSQTSHVKQMSFVLDYSSLWNFQPVFNQIEISGVNLDFQYESNGVLFINGIQVTDNEAQTLENTRILPFDLEAWLLRQKNIDLNNISLSFEDKKNFIPSIKLHNIQLTLERDLWSKHRFAMILYGKQKGNDIHTNLEWQGGKVENWQSWKNADLAVQVYAKNTSLIRELNQYLPKQFNFESSGLSTALHASIKKGMVQDIHANFDVNNFKLALADMDVVNLPRFGGSLDVDLLNNTKYVIKARNLEMATSSGALFDNAQINGEYLINKNGYLELSNTNLVALNNLLSLFNATNGINLQGIIKNLAYKWDGAITKPSKFQVSANFDHIGLQSNQADLPSLSNVSGNVSFNQSAGNLKLSLESSVLLYNSIFLIPYEFNALNTDVDWRIAKNGVVDVVMHKTTLATKDFSGVAEGKFTYNPNNPDSPSYIDMTAHVERVLTSKVGDYLPKQIPMSVHEWLNMGLIGGYGESADMILKGPLSNFPFQDNSGLFYITANIEKAKLQYVKGWPTLDNIYGKFILKNTNITVKADRGIVGGNSLDPTVVVIPDYSSPTGVYLTADGNAHGSTANFMNYLAHTPINDIIGKFPEKVVTNGEGKLKLYLKVPFKEPKKTTVAGTYTFFDNDIKFQLPIPEIQHVTGDLGFTEHGVTSKGLDAVAFGTKAKLTADINQQGKMHFNVNAPNLDYTDVANFYLPFLSPLISGRANTAIDFTLGKKGIEILTANSDLVGVSVNAPAPVGSESDVAMPIALTLTPHGDSSVLLDWSLGQNLHGQQVVSGKATNSTGQIAVGSANYLANPDNDAVMTVNVNLPEVNIEQWIATIDRALKNKNTVSGLAQNDQKSEGDKSHHNVMPIQIKVQSPHVMIGKSDLGDGTANLMVDKQQTYFNLYTPIASGTGVFNYAKSLVKLSLDKYMLYKKSPQALKNAESYIPLNFVNGSQTAVKMKIPDIDLDISNLFYQNHNLGKLSANLHQEQDNLYLKNGTLTSNDFAVNFSGTNYCFGCAGGDSYVNFIANADVYNLGNIIYNLDFGRTLNNGKGNANITLQWNGGFQDFKILQTVGVFHGEFTSGKFLQVNPGVFGTLFSIINLQGLFEFGSGDVGDIFRKGFFFNSMEMDLSILTSRVEMKNFEMVGPMAQVNSLGILDFANNTVNAEFSITPHVGFAVALAAGVATLNPLIGVAVYGAEMLSGSAQNKLLAQHYHVKGNMKKPVVEKNDVTDSILRNMNSTVGLK